ncbi:MAG: bifunctional folylpolyglutamate synthase/dihydrofolate synthase [Nitrospinaceae bacterium]
MDYQESLNYLENLTQSGIKLGLENTARLLDALGNPQWPVPTVHIAGTNGKGSTAAFVESILRAAGHRVGLYTSPHLLDFRERIQVNREQITAAQMAAAATRVRAAGDRLNLAATYFEVGTVMALLHFRESGCQWNVIETGLGGRLDSTNLCRARVAVLTAIAQDHEAFLGAGLSQIAGEKAAIIKGGEHVVAAAQEAPVLKVIRGRAQRTGSALWVAGEDFSARRTGWDAAGQTFTFHGPQGSLEDLRISLLGRFQVENAAVAAAVCQALSTPGESLPEQAIREGLRNAAWPGRMEVVGCTPWVILDCAHNLQATRELALAVREHFSYDRCRVVLGVMRDKNLGPMLRIMGGLADHLVLTRPPGPRGAEPSNLLKLLPNFNKLIEIIEEIPYALRTVRNQAGPRDLILVTGSVFTVAEAKQGLDLQESH